MFDRVKRIRERAGSDAGIVTPPTRPPIQSESSSDLPQIIVPTGDAQRRRDE